MRTYSKAILAVVIIIVVLIIIAGVAAYFGATTKTKNLVTTASQISNTSASPYKVVITYASNPIASGKNQTITVSLSSTSASVSGLPVSIQVSASGSAVNTFDANTSSTGVVNETLQISPNSSPGVFQVIVVVADTYTYGSSFNVTSS